MISSARLMTLLLLLQADATILLVSLSLMSTASQTTFALFLAIALVGFAMTSYAYRSERNDEHPHRGWLVMGCCALAGLLFSTLVFT